MKTYDIVKQILLSDPQSRDLDKRLMWKVWEYQGIDMRYYSDWIRKASHPKSIIESRRNLQRSQEAKLDDGVFIPEQDLLIASKKALKYRDAIDKQKGTHIFREQLTF